MRFVAILEIENPADAALPADLLQAAYLASRRGPVALLIPPGSDRTVDRELDPLVAAEPRVHGVRYGRVSDARVWAATSPSTVVVASSRAAKVEAAKVGVGCLDPSDGLEALTRLGV